jgi:hypothetical protein
MTAAIWFTVGGLAITTALIKASGPVLFGGRDLHPLVVRVIPLLPPVLLAALVVTEAASGRTGTIAARAVGLAIAVVAIAVRVPLVVVVIAAAIGTALFRAIA